MAQEDRRLSSKPKDSVLYFDAHSDIPTNVVNDRAQGRSNVISNDFLPGMQEGGIQYRLAAVFVNDSYLPEQPLRRALDIIVALRRDIEETPEVELATTTNQLSGARSDEDLMFILGMEGAEPLMGNLSLLDIFHQLGLRLLTLTHSRRNAVADGCFYSERRSGTAGGLTDFGVNVVERLAELGIVLDVSHLNQPGFWDVVEFANGPFIASHSNSKAVHDHPRNVTDEQIAAVADAGGVIGLTPVADFVGDDPILEDFLDHVEHVVEVAGIEHVGFGFDFFEYMTNHRPTWNEDDPPFNGTTEGIGGDEEVKHLAPALKQRGFSRSEINKLARDNYLNLFVERLD